MSATQDQKEVSLQAAKTEIAKIISIDPETLGRRSELAPTINFEDIVPVMAQIVQIFRDLSNRTLDRLCKAQLNQIAADGKNVPVLVEKILQFSIEQGDAKNNCDAIKEEAHRTLDNLISVMSPILSFTATQATDYAKIEREAQGLLSRVDKAYKEFSAKLSDHEKNAATALTAIQQQAADAGVSQNARYFSEEADVHLGEAGKWRKATIWCIVAATVASVGFLVSAYLYVPSTTPAAIQLIAAKIIVISIITFSMVWCSKNYRSHRHNWTVNTHRKNALSTFKTFVEGSDNNGVKEAILLAAADAAFSSRSTGFDAPEPESGNVNAQQAETVLRIAMRSSTSGDS